MVSGIYFVLRTGLPWRDLPKEFGPWSSVYTRFRRWCKSERWSQMLALLTIDPCSSLCSVDCTHIKAHQDASNAAGGAARSGHRENQGREEHQVGRSRGWFGPSGRSAFGGREPARSPSGRSSAGQIRRLLGHRRSWIRRERLSSGNHLSWIDSVHSAPRFESDSAPLLQTALSPPPRRRKLLWPHQAPPPNRHSVREAQRDISRLCNARHDTGLALFRGLKTRPNRKCKASAKS